MRAHLVKRAVPRIVISDETERLLESGGGIVRALPLLGREPFFVLNADTFWVDDGAPSLSGLALAWDGARMDILLMLAAMGKATGHSGRSDFLLGTDGRLARSGGDPAGLIYAGAAIVHPRIFAGAEAEPHSLNRYFDLAAAEGGLFGWRMHGRWITVGTPEAIPAAEAAVAAASVS
jgi:MurNAc alpha-1-phosphate uridylyltransferase